MSLCNASLIQDAVSYVYNIYFMWSCTLDCAALGLTENAIGQFVKS